MRVDPCGVSAVWDGRAMSTARLSPLLLLSALAGSLQASCSGCEADGLQSLVPLITPSASPLQLGPAYVGASATGALSLRSAGTAHLELTSVTLEGDPSLRLEGPVAGRMAPGDLREVRVTFTPTDAGSFLGTLVVLSDAENDPELRLAVLATALAAEDCDDENPCTDEVFDPARGECITAFRSGPCDDGSRCTTDDRCADGRCVGTAVACEAASACERGVCANDEGCLSVPDPAACADDNPCTLDSCDALLGCAHEAAPNGTPCAAPSGCEEARVCLAGACVAVEVPDGTPCADGDLCTVADVCQAGACVGTRVEREPEVVGTLRTFGAPRGEVVALDDGGLLFFDGSRSGSLAAVGFSDDELAVEARLSLSSVPNGPPLALPAGRALLLGSRSGSLEAIVVERQGGVLLERGAVPLGTPTIFGGVGRFGEVAYLCRYGGIDVVNVTDPDAPSRLAPVSGPAQAFCASFAVDEAGRRAFSGWSTGGLLRLDLSAPEAPLDDGVLQPERLYAPLAFGAGRLVAYRSDGVSSPGSGGPPREGGELVLMDPATLAVQGQIEVAQEEVIPWLGFVAETLAVARQDGAHGAVTLELWDVSDPTAPALLDEQLASTFGYVAGASGPAVVALSSFSRSAVVFQVGPGPGLRRAAAPEQGEVTRVAPQEGGVVTLAQDAVRAVSLIDPTAPAVTALSLLPFWSGVFSFGAERGPPTWLPLSDFPDASTASVGTVLGTWVDASVVDAAVAAGAARLPLGSLRALRSTGTALYAVAYTSETDRWSFETFDLEALPAGFELTLAPAGVLALPFSPSSTSSPFVSVAVDEASARAAIAVNRLDGGEAGVTELALLDVAELGAPSLVASTSVSGLTVHGAALRGEVMVVTGRRASPDFQSYRADHLVVFAAAEGTLTEVGAVALPDAGHVLAFTGETALVAKRTGVVFVDVTGGAPTVIGEVFTAEPVIDATVARDHLVVTGTSAVEVISPPCPPAP